MRLERLFPNTLPTPRLRLLLVHAAYKEGGPAAEARFDAGVAGYEARSFRGCGVFTSEPFEVSDDADSVQMLTRSSQVGEFYTMMPPQVPPMGDDANRNLHTADLMIYDEEKDQHVRITWRDALAATCASDGKLPSDTKVSCGNGEAMSLSDWRDAAEDIAKYSSGVDDKGKKVTEIPKWDDLKKDIRIVVARPFIEHLMHNVILAVAGRETGATLFGPADMQLSANTQVKTIEGACRARAHTRHSASHLWPLPASR